MKYTPPDPSTFLSRLAAFPCCPATTTGEQFRRALASKSEVVLILRANGLDLAPFIGQAHQLGKLVAVHLDLVLDQHKRGGRPVPLGHACGHEAPARGRHHAGAGRSSGWPSPAQMRWSARAAT